MSFKRFVLCRSLFLEAAAVRVSGSLITSVRTPLVLVIRRRSTSGEVELRTSRPLEVSLWRALLWHRFTRKRHERKDARKACARATYAGRGLVRIGCRDESEPFFERDPALRTTLKSWLLDRFQIPVTPKNLGAKARERIRASAAVDPNFQKEYWTPHMHIYSIWSQVFMRFSG